MQPGRLWYLQCPGTVCRALGGAVLWGNALSPSSRAPRSQGGAAKEQSSTAGHTTDERHPVSYSFPVDLGASLSWSLEHLDGLRTGEVIMTAQGHHRGGGAPQELGSRQRGKMASVLHKSSLVSGQQLRSPRSDSLSSPQSAAGSFLPACQLCLPGAGASE